MSYSQGAFKHCCNVKFWRFLNTLSDDPVNSPKDAANELRRFCNIKSRSELDDEINTKARRTYEELIDAFNQHLKGGNS